MDGRSIQEVITGLHSKNMAQINSLNDEMNQRVYFFERPDGSVIYVDEKSAWTLYSRPQQTFWGKKKFKYLGQSSGAAYFAASEEARALGRENPEAKVKLQEGLEKEIEAAKGDTRPPPNFDSVGNNGMPVNMRNL
jgi:hypothetical protein